MPNYSIEEQGVFNLQKYLRQLSYINNNILPTPIDGIFESQTKNSLISFQNEYDLEATGIADAITFEKLYNAYLESLNKNILPKQISIFPRFPENHEIKLGDNSFAVAVIQYMLREISLDFGNGDDIQINGTYDTKTHNAIASFQSKRGIESNGITNLETWNNIVSAHNLRQNEYHQ